MAYVFMGCCQLLIILIIICATRVCFGANSTVQSTRRHANHASKTNLATKARGDVTKTRSVQLLSRRRNTCLNDDANGNIEPSRFSDRKRQVSSDYHSSEQDPLALHCHTNKSYKEFRVGRPVSRFPLKSNQENHSNHAGTREVWSATIIHESL